MERPRRTWSVAIGTIATVIGVSFLLSSFSWVPSSVLAPFVGPQRIERPDAGFAISLPVDWEHRDATRPDDWWDSEQVGDPGEMWDQVIADGVALVARTTSPLVTLSGCAVYDFTETAAMPPAWTSIADVMTDIHLSEQEPDRIDVKGVYLDLPAGQAARLDTLWKDGTDQGDFLFLQGTTWFRVECSSSEPPEDRWLSIPETFEFLPVEE